jgi:hypothetical protein
MDDQIILAELRGIREEFRAQNQQTESAVNAGFIAIRQEMRAGIDRLTDRMTTGIDDIAAKMLAHEREDHATEKRVAKVEIDLMQMDKATIKREADASEALRRHSAIAGILAGFGVMGLSKIIDWLKG